jgi:hypothetical protein
MSTASWGGSKTAPSQWVVIVVVEAAQLWPQLVV